jgi:hypothetical protein
MSNDYIRSAFKELKVIELCGAEFCPQIINSSS